jgi:ribonuclease Z
MNELVVLGTGGRGPTRMRAVSSYLVLSQHGNLLLDPGEGALRQLILMGLASCRISRIFISSHRLDHCLGLPSILQHLKPNSDHTVDIFVPQDSAEPIGQLLSLFGLAAAAVQLRPLDDGAVIAGADVLRVRALEHADAKTLGLRLEADGASFAFIPDTVPCDAARDLARATDFMLCQADDLHHRAASVRRHGLMTAREAAELARDAGTRRLLLSHFQPRQDEPSAFLHEARSVFPASDVARDLTTYKLAGGA